MKVPADPTIDEQLDALRREVFMREIDYPHRVAAGLMTADVAVAGVNAIRAAIRTIKGIQQREAEAAAKAKAEAEAEAHRLALIMAQPAPWTARITRTRPLSGEVILVDINDDELPAHLESGCVVAVRFIASGDDSDITTEARRV